MFAYDVCLHDVCDALADVAENYVACKMLVRGVYCICGFLYGGLFVACGMVFGGATGVRELLFGVVLDLGDEFAD